MLVIPELTTLEAAGIKTKADGPFDSEVTDAVSLITATIAGSATGRSKEAINRGNCRLKENTTTGRYAAFLYVGHE